jgi:peptidoglycan/xylan/chitin deacetylase (PgdA/CDA1 family)
VEGGGGVTGPALPLALKALRAVEMVDTLPPRPPRHAFDFITRFAPGHGWVLGDGSGSCTESSDDPCFGFQAIAFERDSIGSTPPAFRLIDLDLRDKMLVVWMKCPPGSGGLNVYAGNSNLSEYHYWNAVPVRGNVWEYVVLPFSAAVPTGTPDRTRVERLHVTAGVHGEGVSVPYYLGGVATTPNLDAYPNGAVSITFDDSLDDAWAVGRPIMDEFGFGGTGYFLPYTLGDRGTPTLTQLHRMEENHGWEIAGHGFARHSDLTTLPEPDVDYDVRTMRKWLLSHGFRGQDHFAYPYGAHNPSVREVVARYFQTARAVVHPERLPLRPAPSRLHQLSAYTWSERSSLAEIMGVIDAVVAARSWGILLFHTIDRGGDISSDTFGEVLSYLHDKSLAVEPVGRIMQTWV